MRKTREIERLHTVPLYKEFREYLRGQGRPIIFTGVVKNWPSFKHWSFDWFVRNHGDVRAPVRIFTGAGGQCDEPMVAIRDFIKDGNPIGYLSNYNLEKFIPSLKNDCPFPRYFISRLSERNHWIGFSGTKSLLHRDFANNMFAQIRGKKRFLLFAPEREVELDPVATTWYSSFSGLEYEKDIVETPSLDHLPTPDYDFVIEEGELLLMPYGWWHRVMGLTAGISVNLWWWTPKLAASRVPVMLYEKGKGGVSGRLRSWRKRVKLGNAHKA
jgi:hypothetical protein